MSVSNKMYIPKTINVGYQERTDTYTGKLAYVVYTDDKGVLRKEKSWAGWIKEKLGKDAFDNVPTDGFVLNKKVGGYKSDWNFRQAYVRVYDPRGFEFEIQVPNLLHILQETSSIKGKGLEGQFVYAWAGSELILLPVDCEAYRECTKFTKAQGTKVGKSEMVEGCIYQMKDMTEVMYLGRHSHYERTSGYYYDHSTYKLVQGKAHVFAKLKVEKKVCPYLFEKGFTKIASRLSSQPEGNYADIYTEFKNSRYSNNNIVDMKIEEHKLKLGKREDYNAYHQEQRLLMKEADKFYAVCIKRHWYSYHDKDKPEFEFYKGSVYKPEIQDGQCPEPVLPKNIRYGSAEALITRDELLQKEFYRLILTTEGGCKVDWLNERRD